MRKKVTSTDIAKKAGVSQATVSMVLNHKYNVSFSKETVEKIERIAKEMGYTIPKTAPKKGEPEREADYCILSNPYQSVLCHAASGN